MLEDSLPTETMRVPEAPSSTVLDTRAGAVEATRPLLKASLGGDFKVCHFSPGAEAITPREARSLDPLAETIPCSRFRGVLPLASSGCIGTMPRVLLL